ncbi:MAG: DUF151 domain-containing protein [Chloroflexi bacterium]|nr:DUF151 domain-containing protein [Chloroflexota bacterium]
MNEREDAALVALARRGDKEAFGVLVGRYQGMAERVAGGMVSRKELARDLAQEAMLQAYLSLGGLHDDGRFQSWLYGIALNVCRGFLRDQKADFYSLEALSGGTRFEAIPFTGIEPSPHEIAEARELHEVVLSAVNSLSPRNRAATLMFYYEQLSVREIAATLGISVAAVKGRLHKARSQLREMLLPVYQDLNPARMDEQEGRKMVRVTIADVVKQERQSEDNKPPSTMYVVVLADEQGRRALPIWVGAWEGEAIAMGMREFSFPRPLTYNFMVKLLDAVQARVEEVRIESLQADTFYAVVKLRWGNAAREVDARPSDALALAVRTSSPIYAADDVMERAGVDIPEGASVEGRGLNALIGEIEAHTEQWRQYVAPTQERTDEAKEKAARARQELMDFVFGREA